MPFVVVLIMLHNDTSSPGEMKQVFVNGLQRTLTIAVEDDEFLSMAATQLKAKIRDKEVISPDEQRLVFASKELADNIQLRDVGVRGKSTLLMFFRVKGGEPL